MPASTGRSPAVRRATRILTELASRTDACSVADLARLTGTPKSSVADICGVLIETGMVGRELDGRLRLGGRIGDLARGFVGGTDILERFEAECDRIHGLGDMTVVLAVLIDTDVAYVAVRRSGEPLPLTLKPGMRLPAWSTGTGLALLSDLPDDTVRDLHQHGPPLSPSERSFDMDELLTALSVARDRGYASNADTGEMALAGTAVLVHGSQGAIAAVGSVSALDRGRDSDRDAVLVKQLARRLSALAGIRRRTPGTLPSGA
ncbi:IclR family transcriptional regulator [Phytoactinopolyspora halotolerans]|uniref:Helix-turn-helix domain-containing protein n=1 Tax=Phytoactinopolyspora halotolerans TaxID=1981512 RepID=A0A6L9SEP2_9ACTN|nr:helix-turn-helix domain-containing protein [Phytoactinopolyspora halotolerans]NEE03706.1 helix-turn-helix domain-containing protein [Phytoactinopolyspora halotolerans]